MPASPICKETAQLATAKRSADERMNNYRQKTPAMSCAHPKMVGRSRCAISLKVSIFVCTVVWWVCVTLFGVPSVGSHQPLLEQDIKQYSPRYRKVLAKISKSTRKDIETYSPRYEQDLA